MKVSNKIISGFLILTLLAVVVLANQLNVIHQMQTMNRELSEIDMKAATTALDTEELVENIKFDTRKFFLASQDAIYEDNIASSRQDFLENLANLRKTARS